MGKMTAGRARAQIKKVNSVAEIRRVLAAHSTDVDRFKIDRIDLFGSFARGQQNQTSDIDLLITFREPVGYFHFYDVRIFLENALKRSIDLVVSDALDHDMRDRITEDLIRVS